MSKTVDVFPANVVVAPVGKYEELSEMGVSNPPPSDCARIDMARVLLMNNRIMVVQDSPEGPTVLFQEDVIEYFAQDNVHRVKTKSFKTLAFTKDRNCGCGSRLRTWNPYSSIQSTKDPE
jgi:hypothetical protein